MSYDYTLLRALGPGPLDSWPGGPLEVLEPIDELRRRFAESCPELAWEDFQGTWFGRCEISRHPEIQLTPDQDGQLRFITLRRVAREEVIEVARRLGLVIVDDQTCELIRP